MNPETKDTQTHDKLSDAGRAQLLGFGILALLAVIFLPIILDGHPESNSETQEANHALAIDEDALPNAEILEEYEDLIILLPTAGSSCGG
ncbi:MAG: hypothetical protein ACYYK0_02395 [Candidatus Eutrophobiaceae bacterium]